MLVYIGVKISTHDAKKMKNVVEKDNHVDFREQRKQLKWEQGLL